MEWDIEKSRHACGECDRKLEEDEEHVSALFEEDDNFMRRDYCLTCWAGLTRSEGMFSFWRRRVPVKGEKKKLFVDDSVIMAFFRRLATGDDPKRRNFRYILSLMLMRKKKLKFVDARFEGDKEILILKAPREEDLHEVVNPKLSDEELTQVQEDLGQILETTV